MSNSRQVLANNLNIKSIFNTAEYINNLKNTKINSIEENFYKLMDITFYENVYSITISLINNIFYQLI